MISSQSFFSLKNGIYFIFFQLLNAEFYLFFIRILLGFHLVLIRLRDEKHRRFSNKKFD